LFPCNHVLGKRRIQQTINRDNPMVTVNTLVCTTSQYCMDRLWFDMIINFY
jgi:hypothetical protein